jgi:hypothetical protein
LVEMALGHGSGCGMSVCGAVLEAGLYRKLDLEYSARAAGGSSRAKRRGTKGRREAACKKTDCLSAGSPEASAICYESRTSPASTTRYRAG